MTDVVTLVKEEVGIVGHVPNKISKLHHFLLEEVQLIHSLPMFSACTDLEKEWCSLLASYVNGLTVLSID